jgi:hypothetical protein
MRSPCAGRKRRASDWAVSLCELRSTRPRTLFAPWLDPSHDNPAKPGQLRWYATDEDGKDMEVDGPEEIGIDGRMVKPLSRTLFGAGLKDNPFLSRTYYASRLDALTYAYARKLHGIDKSGRKLPRVIREHEVKKCRSTRKSSVESGIDFI